MSYIAYITTRKLLITYRFFNHFFSENICDFSHVIFIVKIFWVKDFSQDIHTNFLTSMLIRHFSWIKFYSKTIKKLKNICWEISCEYKFIGNNIVIICKEYS